MKLEDVASFTTTDRGAWNKLVQQANDPYTTQGLVFASAFACLMEAVPWPGSLWTHGNCCLDLAVRQVGSIDRRQFELSIEMLHFLWIQGEALLAWYNWQVGLRSWPLLPQLHLIPPRTLFTGRG